MQSFGMLKQVVHILTTSLLCNPKFHYDVHNSLPYIEPRESMKNFIFWDVKLCIRLFEGTYCLLLKVEA
jgi:hypothetical protein